MYVRVCVSELFLYCVIVHEGNLLFYNLIIFLFYCDYSSLHVHSLHALPISLLPYTVGNGVQMYIQSCKNVANAL